MNKMQTEPIAPAEAAEVPERRRLLKADGSRNWTRTFLLLIVPALLVIGGAYMWLTSGGSVSTDDAQVKQDRHEQHQERAHETLVGSDFAHLPDCGSSQRFGLHLVH